MQVSPDKLKLLLRSAELKYGTAPHTPTDFELMAAHIRESCASTLSASTLKRLWGYIKCTTGPTYSTLSTLSRYVGYHDWYAFCDLASEASDDDDDDSGFAHEAIIVSANEAVGATFSLTWDGLKKCVITKVAEPSRYKVVETHNIKLAAGDYMTVDSFAVGQSFVGSACKRLGREMGAYVGARRCGLRTINRLDDE